MAATTAKGQPPDKNPDRRSSETAQTLDRGLQIMERIADAGEPLTVAELARRLEVSRAIVYRLLSTLEQHLLVRREGNGRFELGTGLIDLARHVAADLVSLALPEMHKLVNELGDATIVLTVDDSGEGVCLVSLEPPTSHPRVVYRPGYRHSLEITASGMAILAGREPRDGERDEVTAARARGFARSSGDLGPGVGLAVPIAQRGGIVNASLGALSVQGRDESEVTPPLLAAAGRIGAQLG
jgi:DNA-binding IclR family transcriptional regulator